MQTINSIKNIVDNRINCHFFGVDFHFNVQEKGDGFLLQIYAYVPDTDVESDEPTLQKGGKHYISSHAIDDEIYLTAWKAFQDYLIHEARESFLVDEQQVFGPHFKITELAQYAKEATRSQRPDNR